MSARDISHDFFRSCWAFLINLVCLLGWPFYNFKSFKLNKSASPFGWKNRKTFSYLWAFIKATYFAIAMARPRACRSACQNLPPVCKDELARAALRALTNDSGTFSHTSAVLYVPTPALVPPLALAKLVTKYTDANLQRVTKLAPELFVQGQQQAQSQMAPPPLEPQE